MTKWKTYVKKIFYTQADTLRIFTDGLSTVNCFVNPTFQLPAKPGPANPQCSYRVGTTTATCRVDTTATYSATERGPAQRAPARYLGRRATAGAGWRASQGHARRQCESATRSSAPSAATRPSKLARTHTPDPVTHPAADTRPPALCRIHTRGPAVGAQAKNGA